ncbi:MAG: nitroreductase family deazaflavin-dependent oxidoreductase [Chloroflexi bacterium]|jgi:deazaflavin-dependent oxidoreductase (nitroreductase family)|nr:MAG: nitroreductase family deazaflavin-dependent oxidoreductase [Chloroflexota bacterium]TMG07966.1 MAG: nitroreductase family deazaflavin-dependent oxidoreductase [Chloroflexota bacterium]
MTMYHKPSGLVKAMNSLVGRLASWGLIPGGTALLQVKGRRSGQTRSTAVTWVEHDGQRYLVAPRGNTEWVRNVKAAGGEAVLKHGKSDAVRLEELPVEQRAPLIQAYLKKTARVTKREFGIEPDAPIEEFQRIAPDHPVFRITTIS